MLLSAVIVVSALSGITVYAQYSSCYRIGTGDSVNCYRTGANSGTVNEWSVCKDVVNNNGNELFIPTQTSEEWSSLYTNGAPGVELYECGGGGGGGMCQWDCEEYCDDYGCIEIGCIEYCT